MRLGWALVGGVVLAAAMWWWTTRAEREHARVERERKAAAAVEAARPMLYRWRDAQGVLQITQKPPKGRKYTKVALEPYEGIEVHGDRNTELPEPPE